MIGITENRWLSGVEATAHALFVILNFVFGILRNPLVSFLNLRHVIFNFLLVVFFDNH